MIVVGSLGSVWFGHWLSDRSGREARRLDVEEAAKSRDFVAAEAERARKFDANQAETARGIAEDKATEARKFVAYQGLIISAAGLVERAAAGRQLVQLVNDRRKAGGVSLEAANLSEFLKLFEWGAHDFAPLRAAVAQVLMDGSAEAVQLAAEISSECEILTTLASQTGSFQDSDRIWNDQLAKLQAMRNEFAKVARSDLKRPRL